MSDAPSYETYATGRENPRFTAWLRERSEPAFTDAVDHRFVHELGTGTLDESAFASYLVQDYAFVGELVGTFGFAVGEAPSIAAKRPLVEFLETLTDEEDDYFERSFDALDVPDRQRTAPETTATTEAFLDLLGRAAREGGYAETLAVLVPAEWIYAEWATRLVEEYSDSRERDETDPPSAGMDLPFYYAEWVDLHATPAFLEFVDWLRGQLDEHGPGLSRRRQARVARLFCRTVDLEVAFFETALQSAGGNRDASNTRGGST